MTEKRCDWKPCPLTRDGYSVYCAEHREEARMNVLRSLGMAAPTSLMWRDGDERRLLNLTLPKEATP
jgi:hypothetical protein